jgi:hypothetical protein
MRLVRLLMQVAGVMLVLEACAGKALATPVAPEIDPGAAGSAIALLAGGVLLLRSRLRR